VATLVKLTDLSLLSYFVTIAIVVAYPGFLPICQNQIKNFSRKSNQELFQDFQGPYKGYIRRTKLTHRHLYKHIIFISVVSSPCGVRGKAPAENGFMHIWGQKEAIWNTFFSINWFGHGVLENQIQALSVQGPSNTDSRTFNDPQEPCIPQANHNSPGFHKFPDRFSSWVAALRLRWLTKYLYHYYQHKLDDAKAKDNMSRVNEQFK